ncbi:hypothetical protein PM082_010232 [Marasmius tenuissimus]|nr:hypothetical protein PM082_010232 [Marasmius tenuissimus]
MSEDMRGRSWRSLAASAASSRLASFRGQVQGYLAQQDIKNRQVGSEERSGAGNKQTWRQWAGQKIGRGPTLGTEKIALFPGWASKRPRNAGNEHDEEFEVDVFVSGFATIHRGHEVASRSQRTFMRLAKGFAALPKLTGDVEDSKDSDQTDLISTQLTPSTEELLRSVNLPPRPNEMTIEREAELLDRQFRRLNEDTTDSDDSTSSRSSSPTRNSPPFEKPEPEGPVAAAVAISDDLLRTLHGNLEIRLLPFWSSVLPSRTVHVRLYSKDPHHSASSGHALASTHVQTNAHGSFQATFCLGWEDVLEVAFGEDSEEPDFYITAELLPVQPQPSRPSTPTQSHSTELTSMRSTPDATLPPTTSASTQVPLTDASIRVISDIDDTVKHSDIPGGARSVFRNVFVNELDDLVIPGMGEWFTGMWKKGVRFHYVSNGPFELLPILGDFFKVANLPPGSIKLRSYAGRSLFSGLLTAPAARKRAGVQEIISSFPHSYFILVGDSGEQDLELYTELARESPHQILGIFIRDTGAGDALDDPTGFRVTTAYNTDIQTPFDAIPVELPTPTQHPSTSSGDRRPAPIDTQTPQASWSSSSKTPTTASSSTSTRSSNYFRTSRYTAEPDSLDENSSAPPTKPYATYTRKTPTTPRGSVSSSASSYFSRTTPKSSASTSTNTSSRIPEGEKKRHELQIRVYRARTALPEHIVLRIFRSPSECVEADAILASG